MRLDQEAQRPQTRTHYVTQRPSLTSDMILAMLTILSDFTYSLV